MDRRSLLTLAACLPALSATSARACSVAQRSPGDMGAQNQQIFALFEAWWARDSRRFQGYFTNFLMRDGTPMEPEKARKLRASDPLPADAFDIFDRFFTDTGKFKRIKLLVNTGAGVVVGCSESDRADTDCWGFPKLHLFLVDMAFGLNPRRITHIATADTTEVDRFAIWTSP